VYHSAVRLRSLSFFICIKVDCIPFTDGVADGEFFHLSVKKCTL